MASLATMMSDLASFAADPLEVTPEEERRHACATASPAEERCRS